MIIESDHVLARQVAGRSGVRSMSQKGVWRIVRNIHGFIEHLLTQSLHAPEEAARLKGPSIFLDVGAGSWYATSMFGRQVISSVSCLTDGLCDAKFP